MRGAHARKTLFEREGLRASPGNVLPEWSWPARTLVFVTLLCLTGCIIPARGLLWGRGAVADGDLANLRDSAATREDVLLRLGAPDMALNGGETLVYDWGMYAGFVVMGSLGGGTIPGPHHRITLDFTTSGSLLNVQKTERLDKMLTANSLQHPEALPKTESRKSVVVMDPLAEVWARLGSPHEVRAKGRVAVKGFRDGRPAPYTGTLIGRNWDYPGMEDAEYHTTRPVHQLVQACAAKQLEREGFPAVEDGADYRLSGVVETLRAEGRTVVLEVSLEARSSADGGILNRRYRTTAAKNWGSPPSIERLVRKALERFQASVAADQELIRFLGMPKGGGQTRDR